MGHCVILHQQPEDFKNAIQATSTHLGIREVFIEKDYWVTLMLFRLSRSQHATSVVFKGGTSLSKAYNVIKRFSEDVDLATLCDGLNSSQIKALITTVSKELTDSPFADKPDNNIETKKGNIRRTLHEYPKLASGDFGIIRKEVLLEINAFTKPSPSNKMTISSFIYQFLAETEKDDLIKEFGLAPFEIQILDSKITFLEKILSLAYAAFEDGENIGIEVRQRARHFYDLTMLFQIKEIQQYLNSPEAIQKLKEIRSEENLASRIKWKNSKLKDASLFKNLTSSLTEVEKYYASEIRQLLFKQEDLNPFTSTENCFKEIKNFLLKE